MQLSGVFSLLVITVLGTTILGFVWANGWLHAWLLLQFIQKIVLNV
jgi:hypothetical protein